MSLARLPQHCSSCHILEFLYIYKYMGVSENSVPLNPMVNVRSAKQRINVTIWVCLKIVYPIVPNGFADHYPH